MVHEAGQHHDTLAPLRSIDLFCGAGGLACGLTSRGFDVRLGSDIWKPAADTYRANFPGHRFEQVDIRDLTASDILEASGGTPPDLVAGGGVSLCFSSSCEGLWRRVGGPVGLAVSEHGEQDIDSAPGEADECGVVFLALGSFPVVVGPADGIGSERGER